MGGIGGNSKQRYGSTEGCSTYAFSGPVEVKSCEEVELEALFFVIRIKMTEAFKGKRVVICSDSRIAMDEV